jgi:hypothetical protein
MAGSTNAGDYTYSNPASNTFRIVGHLSTGTGFTVP